MYQIGTILKTEELFYTHVGVYIGQGMVLHNHWRTGECAVSFTEFSGEKRVLAEYSVQINPYTFNYRVQQILANPRQYDLFTNNCEHTISRVMNGEAKSPQLVGFGIVALCFSSALLLSRANG